MAIKPILFNTEMVRANLDGKKSCTRRIVKPQPTNEIQCPLGICTDGDKSEIGKFAFSSHEYGGKMIFCKPPYQPEDILYVRETWHKDKYRYIYRADYQDTEKFYRNGKEVKIKWKPSIRMPKEAARIWLKVTDVRVERLQEMKPVDVIKEGAYPDCWDCLNTYGESGSQCCYGTEEQCSQCDEVMMEWEKLWTSTIKKSDLDLYGWNANPWVWTIEYERCEKPEGA